MLGRYILSRVANRKSQKLFLSVEMAKNLEEYPYTISTKEASYTINRSRFLGTMDWCRLKAIWDLCN